METKTCLGCQVDISWRKRSDTVYCSHACRMRVKRSQTPQQLPETLPKQMTGRKRWVRYTDDKRPVQVNSRSASVTDANTWGTYSEVKNSPVGAGIGYVLAGDGIACIDLDNCLSETGELSPVAAALVAAAPDTWVEISKSGRGLHIWGLAVVPKGRVLNYRGQSVEVYGDKRYIALTGRNFSNRKKQLGNIQRLVDAVTKTSTGV